MVKNLAVTRLKIFFSKTIGPIQSNMTQSILGILDAGDSSLFKSNVGPCLYPRGGKGDSKFTQCQLLLKMPRTTRLISTKLT